MNPEQIIDFIRQQLIQGKSRWDIEQILRLNNVSEKEIGIAFRAAEWQKEQNVPSPVRRARRGHPLMITFLILLLIISGAGAYITLYQPDLLNKWLGNSPEPVPETSVVENITLVEPVPTILETTTEPVATSTTATSTDATSTTTPATS